MTKPDSRTSFSRPEVGIIWMIWMTYGSFYFCRVNTAAAVPGILEEFDFSKAQMGMILGSLKIAYGVGQFINGQVAERFSPRKLLAIGMLGSACMNVLFGFGSAVYFLLFVWATNGYFQSFGWTPCMRTTANWFPASKRGRAIGIIGTGYQATASFTFLLSGFAAERFGWRGAFYIPAALLVASCVHTLLFLKESPDTKPADSSAGAPMPRQHDGPKWSVWETLKRTLNNPKLWFLALSLGLLNSCRYGFLDWGITHLIETQGGGVAKSALKYVVLPLGGIPGALVASWATDRFFNGRRAPVICILLFALGCLTLLYNSVIESGIGYPVVILAFIGFCIYGPQVLLVGTAPIDLARKGTAAASVGFVNFMGYMGASSSDLITGALADRLGWNFTLYYWAGCAFAAAAAMLFLWKQQRTEN